MSGEVPRRDLMPLWGAAEYWSVALVWVVFTAMVSDTPSRIIGAVAVAGFAAAGVFKGLRLRRQAVSSGRSELLAALLLLPPDALWASRGAGVLFQVQVRAVFHFVRSVYVAQYDTADFRDLDREGLVPGVAHLWSLVPFSPRVDHEVTGTVLDHGDTWVFTPPGADMGVAGWLRYRHRAAKAGILHATPDEVRHVAGLLRDAEPVAVEGDES